MMEYIPFIGVCLGALALLGLYSRVHARQEADDAALAEWERSLQKPPRYGLLPDVEARNLNEECWWEEEPGALLPRRDWVSDVTRDREIA